MTPLDKHCQHLGQGNTVSLLGNKFGLRLVSAQNLLGALLQVPAVGNVFCNMHTFWLPACGQPAEGKQLLQKPPDSTSNHLALRVCSSTPSDCTFGWTLQLAMCMEAVLVLEAGFRLLFGMQCWQIQQLTACKMG